MSELGDDELACVFSRVDVPNDRKSISQVCKQWLRVEGRTRSSIRVLELDSLQSFLPRFPNLVSFESSKRMANTHLEFVAETCPILEVLNLNIRQTRGSENLGDGSDEASGFDDLGDDGVCAIANGCGRLTKVMLRRRRNVGNDGIIHLVKFAPNLTTLDLGWCRLIDDRSLEAIGGMSSIRVLNLEGCWLITDGGLGYLVYGSSSKTLKKLALADCDKITDSGVSMLQKISCLEELNLADCGPKVTDLGAMSLASIQGIKRLNFSWLINISDVTVTTIAENCRDLKSLDLTGCELITGDGVRAFASHECLESLVLASCHNIGGQDVAALLNCRSLRCAVLDKRLRTWVQDALPVNGNRFCELRWR